MRDPRQSGVRVAAPSFVQSTIDAHIGSELRKVRVNRGLTIGRAALFADISELDLARAERGLLRLPPLVLIKLIKALRVRLVDLMPS